MKLDWINQTCNHAGPAFSEFVHHTGQVKTGTSTTEMAPISLQPGLITEKKNLFRQICKQHQRERLFVYIELKKSWVIEFKLGKMGGKTELLQKHITAFTKTTKIVLACSVLHGFYLLDQCSLTKEVQY